MKFGKGAWIALFGVTVGAIAWTEMVMAAIRSGTPAEFKVAVLAPFLLLIGFVIVWRLRHPMLKPAEKEAVRMRAYYKGAMVFLDRGTLRRDGGLLVFEGTKAKFAIGHDALLDRPVNLIGDYGAKLKDAPKGTRLALRGDPKLIRKWAKDGSEPTRTPIPLLVMPEPEGAPKGWFKNYLLFSLGCAAAGSVIGGYLDARGFSQNGRPLVVLVPIVMVGVMAQMGLTVPLTANRGKRERTLAREAGFRETEPWQPAPGQSTL